MYLPVATPTPCQRVCFLLHTGEMLKQLWHFGVACITARSGILSLAGCFLPGLHAPKDDIHHNHDQCNYGHGHPKAHVQTEQRHPNILPVHCEFMVILPLSHIKTLPGNFCFFLVILVRVYTSACTVQRSCKNDQTTAGATAFHADTRFLHS